MLRPPMRLPDLESLRRKLRKLRRDPELFVYDFLKPRIESRPVPEWKLRPVRKRPKLPVTRANTRRELDAAVDRFSADVGRTGTSKIVFIFSGTTFIQDVRANRPIRLARMFRRLGAAVVFSFFRWRADDPVPPYQGDLILQTPIDYTIGSISKLAGLAPDAGQRLFVVGFPFPDLMASIDRFNASGWSTLYDCRDDWELFHQVGQASWYTPEAESFAVNSCDLTCCVSKTLVAKMQSLGPGRRVELSPNAYDDRFLAEGYTRRPTDSPIVGYFGHLTDAWFNWPGMIEIARHRPRYRFEIIGHSAPDDLDLPNNIALLGAKSHPEICEIASRWRAAMIPFKIGQLADGVDPIKIYEYMALGLPTVSFRMPQIADYPYTTTVTTVPEFVRALDSAVTTACDESVLSAFLTEHTWENRARQMLEWADEARADPFKQLVSAAIR